MLSIAKLQNLKAIHNCNVVFWVHSTRCYQSQNYKIWKQFTTNFSDREYSLLLLSIAKLQNLKAIHNKMYNRSTDYRVVINRKTTKFESNSQPQLMRSACIYSCYQSQNYKIWKQFTTYSFFFINPLELLSIAKLQNLKAIHNRT